MRLLPACACSIGVLLAGINTVLAEPASVPQNSEAATATAPSSSSDRVPHPVVYLDTMHGTTSQASESNDQRVAHPVVYDTDTQKAAPQDIQRIPHPVVYLDDEQEEPEGTPVVVPENPDLDTSEPEVAKPTPEPDTQPAPVVATPAPSEPSAAAAPLATLIEEKRAVDLDDAEWGGVAEIYRARTFEPVWIGKTGVTPAGRKLLTTLQTADQWGLNPTRFRTPDVADASATSEPLSPETWAELELKVTAAALRYASHARGGRILNPTEQLSSYLDRKPQLKDPKLVLADLVSATDPSVVLHGLHPKHPQFEKLRQKYLELISAEQSDDAIRIPRGALLRQGVTHPHVALLRKRLEIAKVEPEDGAAFDPEFFDDTVLQAVKSYQKENGLSVDGLVGNGTRGALNDVARPDPAKILANMEQWRWMPDDLGNDYVWVNVPEYKVRFVRNGEVVLEERVIAGQISKQTPLFSDKIETLYFHPKWHVPDSIKVREIYPSLARGGGYVRKQNLRISYNGRSINPNSMNWSNRDIRRYHVYQPPGRGNVLGVVKFTFPNKHMVYLHDTPTKHLFKTNQRTYSHGCVRVRNPVKLAELIVDTANGMSKDDVERILKGPLQETPVKLDKQIPVHLTYFTTWVDEDGNLQAAKDIYGHEKKIKLALDGQFNKIAVGPDHLAPVKYKPIKQQYMGTTAVEDFFKNLFPGF